MARSFATSSEADSPLETAQLDSVLDGVTQGDNPERLKVTVEFYVRGGARA